MRVGSEGVESVVVVVAGGGCVEAAAFAYVVALLVVEDAVTVEAVVGVSLWMIVGVVGSGVAGCFDDSTVCRRWLMSEMVDWRPLMAVRMVDKLSLGGEVVGGVGAVVVVVGGEGWVVGGMNG